MSNKYLLLLAGKSGTGKSAALRDLAPQEGVLYLNCEAGKELPFPNKFEKHTITDPLQIYEAFTYAENTKRIHTIVIDSITFLMDMYESNYVLTAEDTMKAWSNFAQYFKKLMQYYVARSTKNIVATAHTLDKYNESDMVMETSVPIKGALKNQGIEAYFSTVLGCKKVTLDKLEGMRSPLLTLSTREKLHEFKYVFQTEITKETINEKIRSPMGLFKEEEVYIDNNVQNVIQRLHTFYN